MFCIYVGGKAGYASCEITMGIADEHALLQIKQKLGGSVKSRAGMKALRYRLHNRAGMIDRRARSARRSSPSGRRSNKTY
jgi:hypothetical protein